MSARRVIAGRSFGGFTPGPAPVPSGCPRTGRPRTAGRWPTMSDLIPLRGDPALRHGVLKGAGRCREQRRK